MAFIAMNTANPLGKRPYGVMLSGLSLDHLAGDFDFPGAPVPYRDPLLAGIAHRELLIPPPPVDVIPVSSPWTSPMGMTLGAEMIAHVVPLPGATTSTQTAVPMTDTTPQVTAAVPGGTTVQQSWFAQQNLIPGLDNLTVVIALGAVIGIGMFLRRG